MNSSRKRQQGRRRPPSTTESRRTFSYYGSSQRQNRENIREEQAVDLAGVGRRLRLLPSILAALVIIGSLLFSLTLSARPAVSTVGGEEAVYRPLDEYADTVEKIMNGRLGNKTKLTIDANAVENGLLERYPELGAAALRLPVLGRRPSLVLDINKPVMLLITGNKVFVLDETGTAVSEASALPEDVKQGLLVLRDTTGHEVSVGTHAMTSIAITFIRNAQAQLQAQNLKITEMVLPAAASELDIRVEGEGYFIKTDTMGDARKQIGSFLAARNSGVVPNEYMDVRVEEKVFYK